MQYWSHGQSHLLVAEALKQNPVEAQNECIIAGNNEYTKWIILPLMEFVNNQQSVHAYDHIIWN